MGALNDLLAARHGALAIRWSFLTVVAVGGVAAVFYWRGSRHLAEELRAGHHGAQPRGGEA